MLSVIGETCGHHPGVVTHARTSSTGLAITADVTFRCIDWGWT
jgi:hypothetical protein